MSSKTISRADLVMTLHQEVGLYRIECKKLIDDVVNLMGGALVAGDRMTVANFGTFSIRHKKERMGHNFETGDKAVISARKTVVFKPSKKLKRQVAARSS